ncbi:MAG: LysM peptidoglycan-binding domain-containing protein, partial [Caldilineaceae bacterium]|nr:LysM peptidoglycan-binding domain-containing protein [Caldilineaceae bacterium]
MIQVPQHLSNNRRRGGCCYLVMLLIVGGLLGRITTGEALAQSPTPHSLQLDAVAASLVWVEVDGVVRFHGTMQPQERRVWQGTVLRLTIATESPATVRYDGTISTTVGDAGKIITVQWPTPEEPVDSREPRDPQLYRVQPNDTLYKIATQFGTDIATLQVANQLLNSDLIYVGTVLAIPGSDGTLPEKAITAQFIPMATDDAGGTPVLPQVRGTVTERLTVAAQEAAASSPFYRTTWLTYYGRPAVPVMGILGEHELDELIPRLKAEAAAYDLANGDDLAVRPALHLVYGMATKAPNDDNSHLIFLEDAKVEEYITRAQEEEFAVILDIQIGALTP